FQFKSSKNEYKFGLDINFYLKSSHSLFGRFDGQQLHPNAMRKLTSIFALLLVLCEFLKLNLIGLDKSNQLRWYAPEMHLTKQLSAQNLFNVTYGSMMLAQVAISIKYLMLNRQLDQLQWMKMLLTQSAKTLQSKYCLRYAQLHHLFRKLKIVEYVIPTLAIFFWSICCLFYLRCCIEAFYRIPHAHCIYI